MPRLRSLAFIPLILAGLLVCLGVLLFVELGRGGLGPKTVALIGVLGAAMVALRLPGFVAGFSAMFIVVLVAGNAFGPTFGFLLGAVGTFASGLFIGGLGPWLPFQTLAHLLCRERAAGQPRYFWIAPQLESQWQVSMRPDAESKSRRP